MNCSIPSDGKIPHPAGRIENYALAGQTAAVSASTNVTK
jgi:hypothetical protein